MRRFLMVLLGLVFVQTVGAEPAATPAAPASAPTGSVARAVFTTAVVDREPKDTLSQIPANVDRIYYFTELRGLNGQTVTHRWEYQGKVIAEVKFDVHGARWRVYSNKTLDDAHTGEWKVSTVDAQGNVLSVNTFTYGGAAPATPVPASTSAK